MMHQRASFRERVPNAALLRMIGNTWSLISVLGGTTITTLFLFQAYLLLMSSSSILPLQDRPADPADPMTMFNTVSSTRSSLRLDWTNLSLSSTYARAIQSHQMNCSLPLGDFRFRNRFGLGSDLHVWTQAMCNAMQDGARIRTETPWIYLDESACSTDRLDSSMLCYFPKSELQCPGDFKERDNPIKLYRGNGIVSKGCDLVRKRFNLSFSDVRSSGIEYLFAQVSPLVVKEAERQLAQIFGSNQPDRDHLITVHIRWGDKKKEMKLRPIEEYVKAVLNFINTKTAKDGGARVGIFLATEDPQAVHAFKQSAIQYNWTVYVDAYYGEFEQFRDPEYNGNPRMSKHLKGKPGLVALASLLVALQADDYVLTTSSNWSRLINELRKTVLDSRCNNCTRMVDLSPGEW